MYHYNLSKEQKEKLILFKIDEKEFSNYFNTVDTHNINGPDGFLPQQIFEDVVNTYFYTTKLEKYIYDELNNNDIKLKLDIKLHVAQCFRTYKTYLRLKEKGLSPSKNSQHHKGHAVDIHFYLQGKYIDTSNHSYIFSKIIEILKNKKSYFNIRQVRIYDWGVHIGYGFSSYLVKDSFSNVSKVRY